MKSIKLSLFAALGLLLGLPGCVKEYKKTALKPLSKQSAQFEQTKDNVTLRVKKFDADDCCEAFSGRGKKLVKGKKAIYPLQISVENKGHKDLRVSPKDIAVPLALPAEAINRLQLLTGWRAFFAGFLGFNVGIVPAVNVAVTGMFVGGSLMTLGGIAIVPLMTIAPAIWQGRKSGKFNNALKADLHKKILHDSCVVHQGQKADMLIFVAQKDYRNEFSITLKNAADKKDAIKFDVVLPEKDC